MFVCGTEQIQKNSSPKNVCIPNSVIIYLPSCGSKPVIPLFIFGTQIKLFLIKSKSFLTLHRQQWNWNMTQKDIKRIVKIVHVTSVVFMKFMKLREYILCTKKTKIKTLLTATIYSLPCQFPAPFLTTFLGHKTFWFHCCLFRIDSSKIS